MIPEAPLNVRMGEIVVSSDEAAVLSVIGIGSCLAVAVFSPEQRIGGVAHVVLPDSAMAIARTQHQGRFVEPPAGKFADTAVAALVEELRQSGVKMLTMRAVLVGGAAMFGRRPNSLIASVGQRNIEAVT
ncbi:MAG: chemotaxis protein CheD, partial [Thermoleophilaceae bacterium]|nr:chemotaxis protein CheD [Thermoleophilaceae bacterium]